MSAVLYNADQNATLYL